MPVVACRRTRSGRMDALRLGLVMAVTAAGFFPALASAQTLMPPSTAPSTAPSVLETVPPPPATRPAEVPAKSAAEGPSAAVEAAPFTQPFVGVITADRVYVRSGPGTAYYEIGHLGKGDLVQVVGSRLGWYQILPPNGTFCMVAKELVETDSSGATGTVKADYVNVRAGTALSKNREPSVVLTVVRKGTRLNILGSTDKYYEVAPPEKVYVYVSAQFVRREPGAEYKIPNLQLPPGASAPAQNTVTSVPATLPSPTVEIAPPTPAETSTPAESTASATPTPAATSTTQQSETVVVPPQPAVTFAADAYSRFNDLNKRYQDELQKPVLQRDIDGLLKDYQEFAQSKGLPPSVEQGTAARIAALQKLAAIQQLAKDNASSTSALETRQKALQEQYQNAQKAIEDYEQTGPYLAEGVLQTSNIVQGKYALVNPTTGRVVAYVDPQSAIDISSLLGKYIGVRGNSHKAAGTDITVISVKNATLLPEPVTPAAVPPAR